jgi:hypothetical protein
VQGEAAREPAVAAQLEEAVVVAPVVAVVLPAVVVLPARRLQRPVPTAELPVAVLVAAVVAERAAVEVAEPLVAVADEQLRSGLSTHSAYLRTSPWIR